MTIPLTELGIQQARNLAEHVPKPASLKASGMLRAQQTAEVVSQSHSLVINAHDVFNEFNPISFELISGTTSTERRAVSDAYWGRINPDERMGYLTETFNEFRARVKAGLALARGFAEGTLVVGHGQWISMAALLAQESTNTMEHNTMEQFKEFHSRFHIDNCSLHLFEFHGEAVIHRHVNSLQTYKEKLP